jgi:hypothetical protein
LRLTDAGQAEHDLSVLADESAGILNLGAVVGGELVEPVLGAPDEPPDLGDLSRRRASLRR